jgi:hypothetical protein
MKLYKPQFVALVILAFFASGYIANLGLLLQRPIWQEPVRTYKYTVEPGHDIEITVGGAGDTQTVQESFYHTGNTTWKAPAGVTSVQVELWGGGGAGGGFTTDFTVCRGGGGAGGQYVVSSTVPVTAGTNYTVSIGAGGTGSTGNGNAGSDTTFQTNWVIAKGGAGGQSYENGYAGGAGSTASGVGGTVYAGGNGSDGGTGTTGGAGGGGASTAGTGNNASGNTGGAYKADFGGQGAQGRTTTENGNPATTISILTILGMADGGSIRGYGAGGGGAAVVVNSQTNNRSGGTGAQGGARITYTNNTAYLYYTGKFGTGTYNTTANYPYLTTSTDLVIGAVVYKHASSTITTPADWTLIADIEGGDRPSYLTADQGAVRTVVYAREATSSLAGTFQFRPLSPNGDSSIIASFRFVKSPGTTWEYATSTGADNTANTAWIVTSTNNLLLQPDDLILAVSGINGDAANFTSQSFSAISGITFGEVTGEIHDIPNTSGLDTALVTYMARVYSGTTSTAPLIYTMTASAASTNRPLGSTVFIVIRQVVVEEPPASVEVQDVIFFD